MTAVLNLTPAGAQKPALREPAGFAEERGVYPFRLDGANEARAAFLSQVPLFASLGEKERLTLAETGRVRSFRPGEVLFHEDDPGHTLYVVRSGRVKIVLVGPDGRDTILHVYGPGECLGELSLIDGAPRCATAVAMDRLEVLVLYREHLVALLERSPCMVVAMIHRFAEMVRRLNRQVQDAVSLDLTGRVAKKLLDLASQYGEATPQGIRITLRLSQQELADMVGGARGSVNVCLSAFQERGIVSIAREQITIHKPQELQRRIY
jgi:CRP/FNR family transcriptional regulator, cyclic AMP receptor protein